MPRPNPPRKRPRRRPEAARADAELTKQTAQSTQKLQQPPPKSGGSAGGGAVATAAVPPEEELWSRRSYAILIAIVGGTEVFIGILLWGLAPNPKDTLSLIAEMLGLQPYQPFPLLAACLLAAPVARRITREARPLRFVESLIVGVVIYLLFVLLATAAGFALTGGASGSSTGGAVPTPCPTSSGANATACPSPSATAAPTPTPRATTSPGASPSPNALGSTGTTIPESEVVAAAGVSMALSYVLAVFVYPPLYKRMRVKRPPPGAGRPGAGGGTPRDRREQRARKDSPKK